jgi:hypothetical protein
MHPSPRTKKHSALNFLAQVRMLTSGQMEFGARVGNDVGKAVGFRVGNGVGGTVGFRVGNGVGGTVGFRVGKDVGKRVGFGVFFWHALLEKKHFALCFVQAASLSNVLQEGL